MCLFLLIIYIYILGGVVHIRLDVLLTILVPDMLSMIDEYWNQLRNYSTTSIDSSNNNSTMIIDEQRLKPIEERWRQKTSKRGGGHYTKCPDEPVFTDLLSCLLASQVDLNENIKFPIINPNWLNVAVDILLSVGNIHTHRKPWALISTDASSLQSVISTFMEEWFNSSTNGGKSTRINFTLSSDELNQPREQSIYILENILIPFLPCHLIVNKVYTCANCQSTIKIRCTITSIPVNASRSGLYLERDLLDYFASTSSDLLCSKCNKPTIRRIEVIQWPEVLLININDPIKHVKYRKPPGMLSLAQFSNWITVSCPSASVYDLVSFCSIVKSGENESMVRVTKVKKRWLSSVHKRALGEGEDLRRLYAHSRKCRNTYHVCFRVVVSMRPLY
jgi:ribosomal protein L37AE/L43A